MQKFYPPSFRSGFIRNGFICCLLIAACCCIPASGRSADIPVHGTVTDASGSLLPGVSVFVKGASSGTATNAKGVFELQDVPEDAVLVFSYIGYETKEVKVNGQTVLYVQLQASETALNQVVVVGYGTERKIDLTGAVDQVNGKILENRPAPNVLRGLQGSMPGLYIKMTDGKPSRTFSMSLRGTGSIGAGGSALVLIDGVPGNPAYLNPNDVASVSVLKDAASAAIYGARGAFGVVLITTKHPLKGKMQVNYSANFSLNDRTIKPKFVTNGYLWAKNFDEAYNAHYDYKSHPQKANSVFPFSLDYLDELEKRNAYPSLPKVGIDPATGNYVYYGNSDWQEELYANYDPSTEHQLSVSGGSEKVDYYLSGRYYAQKGLFRYNPDTYKMYNLRAKGSVQAFPWLKIGDNISFYRRKYLWPILNHPSNTPVFRRISDEYFPVAMLHNPDGTLTNNAAIVFGSFLSGNNYEHQTWTGMSNTADFTATFLDDRLRVHGDLTFTYSNYLRDRLYTPVPYSVKPGEMLARGDSRLNEANNTTNYIGTNIYAEYGQHVGKHYFKALVGYNYENSLTKDRFYERYDLINPDLPDFSLIDGENFTLTGGGNEWTTLGGFFRFNYNFNEKYLLEINGRYDGSSKFPQGQQFGFFPSASAGWRISQEPFWKVPENIVSNLKLRVSLGSLGNGNVDPYQFLETMSVSQLGRVINGIDPKYTSKPNVIPNGLTWEKTTTANGGVDAGFLKDRLNLTADVYVRYTTGMFTTGLPLPAVFGAGVPKGNYADLRTQGWELSLNWNDQFGGAKPFHYGLRFVLSDDVTFITKYNNPTKLISTYYEGMRMYDEWGYVTEGFFKDELDIANHADQSYVKVSTSNEPLPGDIKFKDLNGDGKIDPGKGTVDDPGDRKIIGNSHARYLFGLTANADWNNFFFSIFFQGVGKRDQWLGADASKFWGQYNRPYSWEPVDVYKNQWSPDNPDAYFPRLRGYSALSSRYELTLVQTRYLQNAAYIRLKNISFGYNLPASLVSKIGMSNARVYFTGQNLWVWSPMYRHVRTMDPELIERSDPDLTSDNRGDGMNYPMLKTYTLGINLTF